MYKEIEVFNQAELDAIPIDFYGRILIKFGTWANKAVLDRKLENASAVLRENASAVLLGNASAVLWDNASAVLLGNASAVLWDNASAVLRENASAVLRENASAVLWENASAVLRENASAVLWDNASAVLRENARAELWGNARAELWENASAVLRENARAELWENARAELRGNASAVLRENASAVLRENASAVLRENARADASGNAQVVAVSERAKVKICGNARVVYNPKTPEEYAEHNGLVCRDGVMVLYKAVHKRNGSYYSDRSDYFEYKIGETVMPECPLDTDPREDCGSGIHAAHKAWCVDYGGEWADLAILEVEMPMASMVVPVNGSGKVRADRAKVIREVPLEECGLLGEMLAKRRGGV